VFLLLKEMGIDLVAVFNDRSGRFLGLPVIAIADHQASEYDVLIVAALEKPAAVKKRLIAAGVPAAKLLTLQATTNAHAADTPTRV
jgi:hypothetical protein